MRGARNDNRMLRMAAIVAGVLVSVVAPAAHDASAQQHDAAVQSFEAALSPFAHAAPSVSELSEPTVHGVSRTFAPRWKATYGLGQADDTDLTAALLRYDQTLAYGTRSDNSSRDSWRHFLGVEYDASHGFSLLGGIAKAKGGAGLSPTGYEKLRLNAGARWRGDDGLWGVDGAFSFIPTGASRFPGDSGYIPNAGDSSMTYFFALTVSRRF